MEPVENPTPENQMAVAEMGNMMNESEQQMAEMVKEAVTEMPFERDVEEVGALVAPMEEMIMVQDPQTRAMIQKVHDK